jgi:MarR family 2-MHQ and catechol resistance regulon transcriptional repressor
MTVVIDNLEKRGLVQRRRKENDRRCLDVLLTRKGRSLISEIFPGHVEGVVKALAVLTAKEQATLGALCRKLGRATNDTI